MITALSIAKVASFPDDPVRLDDLRPINFIYGANGTGKTTISRVLAKSSSYLHCAVTWRNNARLQTLVYNRDFVADNFSPSQSLRGVFTLGKETIEDREKIEELKQSIQKIENAIVGLNVNLKGNDGQSGKIGELREIEDRFRDICWDQKVKLEDKFKQAFTGFLDSKDRFKTKIINEIQRNDAELLTLEALKERSATLFVKKPDPAQSLSSLGTDPSIKLDQSILKKVIVGKTDIDIASLIEKLGNSDWVKQGLPYLDASPAQCPFCQQPIDHGTKQQIEEYFDEAFEADIESLTQTVEAYTGAALALITSLEAVVPESYEFLDQEAFKTNLHLLKATHEANSRILQEKIKEPSRAVEAKPLAEIIETLQKVIDANNTKASNRNQLIADFSNEQVKLTSQVWKYVATELQTEYDLYLKGKEQVDKAIETLNQNLREKGQQKSEHNAQLQALERNIVSTKPTVDEINGILKQFGFEGFKLAEAEEGRSYKIVRKDGTDALETLSEGERNFVSFLYFFNLINGSHADSGVVQDRVLVIDDPVSSLDSDVLFVVGSLIKNILKQVENGEGHTKQVFLLTHNIFFHKEVTYNSRRDSSIRLSQESFWVVRRTSEHSSVESFASNPITTSYEMLWQEIRNPERSPGTIRNSMRRILENYFRNLGGIKIDDLSSKFEGNEKLVCRSLISWVHDGSHNAGDDLYVSIDSDSIQKYLSVFRQIFEKEGQIAHYNMMMRESSITGDPATTAS